MNDILQSLFPNSSSTPPPLFTEGSYWRDLVALHGRLVTIDDVAPLQLCGKIRMKLMEEEAVLTDSREDGHFFFQTRAIVGRGYLTLDEEGKVKTFFTYAYEIQSANTEIPPTPTSIGMGLSGDAFRLSLPPNGTSQVMHNVVIVGAGQAGLSLSARLKKAGIEGVLVVDKNSRVGDNWRHRYDSLHLHDPRNACSMPFTPMPDHYPKFVHKDDVADYLESYAQELSLPVQLNTSVLPNGATFDDTSQLWTINVSRASSEPYVLTSRHLVIAIGLSGFPRRPAFAGADKFTGKILHSSDFTGLESPPNNVVVVGSNTSAHDIAQALFEKGANVTMVQRSHTTVISLDSHAGLLMEAFNGGGPTASASPEANESISPEDLLDLEIAAFHSNTYNRLAELSRDIVVPACRENDKELLAGLEKIGMKLDWGEDDSGLLMKFLRRGSGYYMSIGCSELIAAGEIKLEQCGNSGVELCEDGVVVDGGKFIPADEVIACTGYTNMVDFVEILLGSEVAEKIGQIGGYGSNTRDDPGPYLGEMRNQWCQTEQRGLWIFCGNFTQARFYSSVTAVMLQIELLGGWDAIRGVD